MDITKPQVGFADGAKHQVVEDDSAKRQSKYYKVSPKTVCVKCGVEVYVGRVAIHNNSAKHRLCEQIYDRIMGGGFTPLETPQRILTEV